MESSPFLHRGAEHAHRYVLREDARSLRDDADRAQARLTLERLRYRWWQRRSTLGSFMQSLGNYGREHFGFLDPRQTGGGWW